MDPMGVLLQRTVSLSNRSIHHLKVKARAFNKMCYADVWQDLLIPPHCNPIRSMYGRFTYMYHKNQPNVGKYTMDPMGMDTCVAMFAIDCDIIDETLKWQIIVTINLTRKTPRKLQHTPGAHPWRISLYSLLGKVKGCVPKVCWNKLCLK